MNDPTCKCGSQVRYIYHNIYGEDEFYCITHGRDMKELSYLAGRWEEKTFNVPSAHQPVSVGALKAWL